jgi:hypothetical protein
VEIQASNPRNPATIDTRILLHALLIQSPPEVPISAPVVVSVRPAELPVWSYRSVQGKYMQNSYMIGMLNLDQLQLN